MQPDFDKLKAKLISKTDYHDVMEYFFENFADQDEFLERGLRVEAPSMQQILTAVVGRMTGSPVTLNDVFLIHLPEHSFIHGGFSADGAMGSFFYFEDLHAGIASLIHGGGLTKTARFSASNPLPRPSLN